MQTPPLRQRVKVVTVVLLSGQLQFRVRGATARGAIQRLHGRGRDREQQFGWQMLRVAAAGCNLPARSLITVPQSSPVCAQRSRAATPSPAQRAPGPKNPAGFAVAAASVSPC